MKSLGIAEDFAPYRFRIVGNGEGLECPAGCQLEALRKNRKRGDLYQQYQAQGTDCLACRYQAQCCPRSPERGRTVSIRLEEQAEVAAFRKKMALGGTPAGVRPTWFTLGLGWWPRRRGRASFNWPTTSGRLTAPRWARPWRGERGAKRNMPPSEAACARGAASSSRRPAHRPHPPRAAAAPPTSSRFSPIWRAEAWPSRTMAISPTPIPFARNWWPRARFSSQPPTLKPSSI